MSRLNAAVTFLLKLCLLVIALDLILEGALNYRNQFNVVRFYRGTSCAQLISLFHGPDTPQRHLAYLTLSTDLKTNAVMGIFNPYFTNEEIPVSSVLTTCKANPAISVMDAYTLVDKANISQNIEGDINSGNLSEGLQGHVVSATAPVSSTTDSNTDWIEPSAGPKKGK